MPTRALWLFRFFLNRAVKYAARSIRGQATWENGQRLRRWIKRELVRSIKWCEKKTPAFTGDEDLVKLFAYAMESDELAAGYNKQRPASQRIEVHHTPGGTVGGVAP